MKYISDGIHCKLDIVNEHMSDLKGIAIENIWQKNEIGPLSYTMHKYHLKRIKDFNVRPRLIN